MTKFAKWAQQVLDEYGEYCVFCGKPSGPPHHFFSRGDYPDLAWKKENGVPVCLPKCHNKIEYGYKMKSYQHYRKKVIEKRGIEWYENLRTSLPEYKRPPKEFYQDNGIIKII